MDEKLTQEELVSSLTTWRALADIVVKLDGYYKDKEGQAYNQLKEIVEGHFKYDYLRNDPECRSIDEILEEKAKQQKPTVTRKLLDKWVSILFDNEDEDRTMFRLKLKMFLEELGMEVEK